jgi:hypothetical protein
MIFEVFKTLLFALLAAFQSKAMISAEILSLRHQLAIYKRNSARPQIRTADKLFFIFLRKNLQSMEKLACHCQP